MKRYAVKEQFLTLQGEGGRAGHKSVFVRFAGCNLWNGRPQDRDKGTGGCARWCDTDFAKGTPASGVDILDEADRLWPRDPVGASRWLVFTGGEPLLQVDSILIELAHDRGWKVAVETNGTIGAPEGIDWLTVSPKRGAPVEQWEGDELKVVLPGGPDGDDWTDVDLLNLATGGVWRRLFVQPQDVILPSAISQTYLTRTLLGAEPEFKARLQRCIDFVMAHPEWALSIQSHKVTNLR